MSNSQGIQVDQVSWGHVFNSRPQNIRLSELVEVLCFFVERHSKDQKLGQNLQNNHKDVKEGHEVTEPQRRDVGKDSHKN